MYELKIEKNIFFRFAHQNMDALHKPFHHTEEENGFNTECIKDYTRTFIKDNCIISKTYYVIV